MDDFIDIYIGSQDPLVDEGKEMYEVLQEANPQGNHSVTILPGLTHAYLGFTSFIPLAAKNFTEANMIIFDLLKQ
jgi:acetyl esterase/lipase